MPLPTNIADEVKYECSCNEKSCHCARKVKHSGAVCDLCREDLHEAPRIDPKDLLGDTDGHVYKKG